MVSADFDDVGVSFDSWSSSVGVEFSTSSSCCCWCCNLTLVATRCRIVGAGSGVNEATMHNEVVITSIRIAIPAVLSGRFFDSGATVIFETFRRTQLAIPSLLRNVDLMMARRSVYIIMTFRIVGLTSRHWWLHSLMFDVVWRKMNRTKRYRYLVLIHPIFAIFKYFEMSQQRSQNTTHIPTSDTMGNNCYVSKIQTWCSRQIPGLVGMEYSADATRVACPSFHGPIRPFSLNTTKLHLKTSTQDYMW